MGGSYYEHLIYKLIRVLAEYVSRIYFMNQMNRTNRILLDTIMGYSTRIHKMVHLTLHGKHKDPLRALHYGLWLNPIPSRIGDMFHASPAHTGNKPIKISLIKDDEIGVSSKLLIWDPFAKSDEYSYPSTHSFFIPIHRGLHQTILYPNSHYGDSNWFSQEIQRDTFSYIYDTTGEHHMVNTCKDKTIMSYHLYIKEESLDNSRA